jgi:hypothetical protein
MQKSHIPEPSPRFIFWSMVVGGLLIAAAIGYDFVMGGASFAAAPIAQARDIRSQ